MSFFGAVMEFLGSIFPYELFVEPWAEKNKTKTVVMIVVLFLLLVVTIYYLTN